MKIEELDYHLPPELIAQHPTAARDDARMLVVERRSGSLLDAAIRDLPAFLRGGDALAVNETRVLPARLRVRRPPARGRIELLFVRRDERGFWSVLARPASRLQVGTQLESEDGELRLEVAGLGPRGQRHVRVRLGDVERTLEMLGAVPLPPYIRRAPVAEDRERYQTIFARVPGAVAAPTAGLHFTPELVSRLAERGVQRVPLVLHVGPGTFRPIAEERIEDHVMEAEWYELGAAEADALLAARAAGGRIATVGTTAVRALESAADLHGGSLGAARGFTTKFIHPPYSFRAVDVLLTNFHLPRSSLLCLVAAFAGGDLVRRAYSHAVARRYRFYSYGDAMLVL